MLEGYEHIPDISWVKVIPDILYIPKKSSGEFLVSIVIPDDKRELHYNESWEVWTITSSPPSTHGSIRYITALTTRLLITTPTGEAGLNQYLVTILFGGIFGLLILALIYYYINRKKKDLYKYNKKPAVFYFEEKKKNENKNKKI